MKREYLKNQPNKKNKPQPKVFITRVNKCLFFQVKYLNLNGSQNGLNMQSCLLFRWTQLSNPLENRWLILVSAQFSVSASTLLSGCGADHPIMGGKELCVCDFLLRMAEGSE